MNYLLLPLQATMEALTKLIEDFLEKYQTMPVNNNVDYWVRGLKYFVEQYRAGKIK